MQHFLNHNLFKILWALTLFTLCVGCQSESSSQIEQPNATTSPSYHLTITPLLKDPTRIKVKVEIDDDELKKQIKKNDLSIESMLTFSLLSAGDKKRTRIPILGEYTFVENRIEFVPAFPLMRGVEYVARFDTSLLNQKYRPSEEYYMVDRIGNSVNPEVIAIYPSGNQLPANHLKFYIHFSQEMQQGDIFKYFSLFNVTKNKPVPRPFRHTELWSADGEILTLWFHPGRQKEGVNLNVELGPILMQGDEYILKISNEWQSLTGATFVQPVEKKFKAIASDLVQPDISNWKETVPDAKTRSPYICTFPAPLDWALLQSKLIIQNSKGQPVKGTITIGSNETTWQFKPEQPWQAGKYKLIADPVLEDLTGNSLLRPFAVDVLHQNKPQSAILKKYSRSFVIRNRDSD